VERTEANRAEDIREFNRSTQRLDSHYDAAGLIFPTAAPQHAR
jgi:hypothetical protein